MDTKNSIAFKGSINEVVKQITQTNSLTNSEKKKLLEFIHKTTQKLKTHPAWNPHSIHSLYIRITTKKKFLKTKRIISADLYYLGEHIVGISFSN